jgi:protein-glutamine gamma-glutamyltransferase
MRDDPFARALAIKLWLDHELIYSTRERHANAEDPTVDFLFGNRTGYCTHFAHSAVFLWRAAGIPSRIGTGYMVPEENRRGGSSILIRSADAHAWPELYLEGTGWVVLDIAAERNLDEAGQPLDEDLQRMLGEMARDEPADPEDEVRDEPRDEHPFELPIPFWMLALIVLGAALVTLYLVKAWRRIVPALVGGRALARLAYRAHLDRLAEVGMARELGETREQFASRVGDLAPSFTRMTDLHVAAHLGDPSVDPASRRELDKAAWRELGRTVRRELRKGSRLWRRLVGLLHPVSFLDSR